MVRVGGIVVCLLIVIMDIVAGILGIEAEIAQSKGKNLRVLIFECKEPVHQAYRLGLAAAIILAAAHVIANLFGGCICISSREEFERSSTNRQMAAATLAVSWYESWLDDIKQPLKRTSCVTESWSEMLFANHRERAVRNVQIFKPKHLISSYKIVASKRDYVLCLLNRVKEFLYYRISLGFN